MSIHGEHPFMAGPEDRDPVRRFRGRLASPVTIITSGDGHRRAGLTVSSLVVVEGDPGQVQAVIGLTSDLWELVAETERFVVHVCTQDQRKMADVFAGVLPSPGGVFADFETAESGWGPVLTTVGDRIYCTLLDRTEVAWSGLIRGKIDVVEVGAISDPLVYFRGRYRGLA